MENKSAISGKMTVLISGELECNMRKMGVLISAKRLPYCG